MRGRDQILDPQLWIVFCLLGPFWKLVELEIPAAQVILAPKARLLRGCRIAPVGCASIHTSGWSVKAATRGWERPTVASNVSWNMCNQVGKVKKAKALREHNESG